jgi:ubiquitin-conjugating enzyme E2 M
MYKGGAFHFSFNINTNYPHEPPKVKCVPKVGHISRNFHDPAVLIHVLAMQIYHPNVDLEGNVCLNILREDWKPVLNLNSVMVGLQYLFLEPNADDPLNKGVQSCAIQPFFWQLLTPPLIDAAEDLRRDRSLFTSNVKTAMRGGRVKNETFDDVTSSCN